MSLNRQIAESIAGELREVWGGNRPTWEDYKLASKAGQVQTNRTVALEAGFMAPVPGFFKVVFGVVAMWGGFIILPIAIVAALLGWVSWWGALAALPVAIILVKVARAGLCKGMQVGAERDEQFYNLLADSGAFMFRP